MSVMTMDPERSHMIPALTPEQASAFSSITAEEMAELLKNKYPTPYDLVSAETIARTHLKAGLFDSEPDREKAFSACMVKIWKGKEMGIPPEAAIAHLYVINGKVSMDAEIALAVVRSKCPKAVINFETENTDEKIQSVSVIRNPGDKKQTFSFTIEKAIAAGLYPGKDTSVWHKYPADQLFAKAVARMCRRIFGDVLMGIGIKEDMDEPESLPPAFTPTTASNIRPPMFASPIGPSGPVPTPAAPVTSTGPVAIPPPPPGTDDDIELTDDDLKEIASKAIPAVPVGVTSTTDNLTSTGYVFVPPPPASAPVPTPAPTPAAPADKPKRSHKKKTENPANAQKSELSAKTEIASAPVPTPAPTPAIPNTLSLPPPPPASAPAPTPAAPPTPTPPAEPKPVISAPGVKITDPGTPGRPSFSNPATLPPAFAEGLKNWFGSVTEFAKMKEDKALNHYFGIIKKEYVMYQLTITKEFISKIQSKPASMTLFEFFYKCFAALAAKEKANGSLIDVDGMDEIFVQTYQL